MPITEPRFRDWLRDCWEYGRPTKEVWDMVVTLFGLLLAVGIGFGLFKAADVPEWAPYAAGLAVAVIYFAVVTHNRIWQAKERRIRELQDRITPKIEIFIARKTNGIETTRGLNKVAKHFVQVHAKAAFDSLVYECKPHITRVEHRPAEGAGYIEVISESLLADWSLQPDFTVTLSRGITHRFNIVSFEDDKTALSHPPGNTPNKLGDFYKEMGKSGQYRYRVHVAGRDIAPIEGHVTVTWRSGALPLIELETIGPENADD